VLDVRLRQVGGAELAHDRLVRLLDLRALQGRVARQVVRVVVHEGEEALEAARRVVRALHASAVLFVPRLLLLAKLLRAS
jgi:hypothetical protein